MLNRRHLRVKVLQVLYAYQQSENKDIAGFEKMLQNYVGNVYEQYLFSLQLLIDVANYAEIDAQERAAKLIPTQEDLNASVRLVSNPFVKLLAENENFQRELKQRKISTSSDQELVRAVFKDMKGTAEYTDYCKNEAHTFASEREFIGFIYKTLFPKSALLEQTMEERDINWQNDKEVVKSMMKRTLKNFSPENQDLAPLSQNWPEDKAFFIELFRKTIVNESDFQHFIANKTKNWDVERIALMDVLLMRMALCELLKFPEIPVKVSINEYIELSKVYSTPKSKIFINGILDKITSDLRNAGKISKTGRGLLE